MKTRMSVLILAVILSLSAVDFSISAQTKKPKTKKRQNIVKKTAVPSGKDNLRLPSMRVESDDPPELIPPPPPKPTATPKPSVDLLNAVDSVQVQEPPKDLGDLPRERRAAAYAKLLEGQRYMWLLDRMRPQSASYGTTVRLARLALQKSVELNPNLDESYTALAELNLRSNSIQLEDTIRLATIAKNINPDNFGARRLLSRVYTMKSGLYGDSFDKLQAEKAVAELKEVVRLDPRNAEAWALLGDFYNHNKQESEEINALKNRISAVPPVDIRFYYSITGKRDLSPADASARLAELSLKAGKVGEAISIINQIISDEPDNPQYIELLRSAITAGSTEDAKKAIDGLQQAVFAAPDNFDLIELLATTQARIGQLDAATKRLRESAEKAEEKDKINASRYYLILAELYAENLREAEAIAAYEKILKLQGIEKTPVATDQERALVAEILPRIVTLYRNAGRYDEAKAVIARMKILLGEEDSSADLQLVQLQRGQGDRAGALQTIRLLRQKSPDDLSLLQTEAAILTDLGKVDEGVALWRAKIVNKDGKVTSPPAVQTDFQAYLIISTLYQQAGRGADSVTAAKSALAIADDIKSDAARKVAKMTLATAQHRAKDYAGSELTLRELLKETPDDATALNNLGYFLLERNERFPEALALIQKAVKIEPSNSSFLDSLGWAYYKLNKFDEAEKYLLDALRRAPDSATSQDHLGDVYKKQGKIEQARQAWQKALSLSTEPDEIAAIRVKLGEAAKVKKTNE